MIFDAAALDELCNDLEKELFVASIERHDDCVAVFAGVLPVLVRPDAGGCRVAVWTTVAGAAPPGSLAAAMAANAYNAAHYHETGMAMAVSVERQEVLLGCSLDAHDLASGAIVDALREVERHRRVAGAFLSEAAFRSGEAGAAPVPLEHNAVRV